MLVPKHYILVLIKQVYMVVLQVGVRFAFQVLKINTLYGFSIYFGNYHLRCENKPVCLCLLCFVRHARACVHVHVRMCVCLCVC